MHIEDAVRSRRAIKGYDSSFSLTREEKDHLLDLALHAPSAFNLQHVRLVEVSDPQLRVQLREVAWDQAQVTDAAMLVVVCAQLDSWERNAQRVWDGAPEAVQAFMAGAIDTYYRGKPQVQRDEAMRSCGLLAQTLMLVARGQGLDSCPMDGFDFGAVARLINLPDNHVIGLMVAVGKKAVEPWPRSGKLPREELVIRDRF
ncbi:nitroreductase family protein [Pseudomonas aeruginosa]|uniref:nitroreductase family protein n=1 Tax=Pseudomonas aeruginosa TaxID=287 RepID=UPI001CD81784|nr:nitroreductase family protein [Pseudomonas aeruginosa]MCO3974623.1 nitroreductase family protein [Pseudomonas aeruginosa]MCT5577091.1 nitroreductase family protein [Pseudomonas aeruginosa]MDN2475854.1 nitroreductase family protein [Pseudomonas aeruginosa]MDN2555295.1 nitroreductase family protein [Pseudomonas aeruginosa]MDN2560200.1 nitroreductase family protein [Pseudomonas aeruginosa]